jgi:hypothetical protein
MKDFRPYVIVNVFVLFSTFVNDFKILFLKRFGRNGDLKNGHLAENEHDDDADLQ